MSALLRAEGVRAGYGDLQILHGVSLEVAQGEWVALLGVAGAGKTTFMSALTGLVPIRAGTIVFDERTLDGVAVHDRVRAGMSLVPEGRRLFAGMSVDDNLSAGAHTLASRDEIKRRRERVFAVFPKLRERRAQVAGTLSGGEAQMCAIGRALIAEPRLMLIDELSLGLAPLVVDELLEALERIRADGTALLVVEQDVDAALRFASRAYVLQTGRIALQGSAADVRTNPAFTTTYMGLDLV